MKSKRRQKLQTNELADQLGLWIERVRPYTTAIVVVAGLLLLVLAAWYYFAASRERKLAESWRQYMLAGTNPQGDIVEDLSYVADEYGDTQAGLWAALTAADVESVRGIRLMFSDRAAAETALNSAKGYYRAILENKQTASNPLLATRTHFGLGQTYEAQSELDEAKKHFAAVVESDRESGLGQAAQKRLERLELAATRKWYNWFDNQKPAPRDLGAGPPSGSPLGAPASDLGTLPEGPSKDFLEDDAATTPPADTPPAQDQPANTAPEDEDTVPEDTVPEDAVPEDTAPTESAAPAQPVPDASPAETPAEE